jgi:hypothetical protein
MPGDAGHAAGAILGWSPLVVATTLFVVTYLVIMSDRKAAELGITPLARIVATAVSALSPSQVVATPGTVYHKIASGMDDPRAEPPAYMARAALLLASESADKVNGRVTYSQQILVEYGLLDKPTGRGVTTKGSGYSQI